MATITRKDGIVYERNNKKINYGKNINIRISEEDLIHFKEVAADLDTNYNELLRQIIKECIDKNRK